MANGSMDFSLNLLANTTGLQQGMNGAKFAVNALVAAMAAVGVGLSVHGLAQAADSYTNLSTRISIATKESGNFEQAISGVHQIALSTNSNLTTTADLFTRLNTVTKDMGMSQQQALDLTKTVTQAIQVGGGSAQAADAAVTQFIQAMQGGVLRGEEFNSIMENGYGLAEALAKGLGVTTGELRKMAEAGELSSERVVTAISSQAASVQATYDKFPTTIGNALQRISTSWEILIGQMDQANSASATVAQWLVTLADNIQELDVVLEDIGEGFIWVRNQLEKVDTATIEALKTALLSAYETLKNVASTLGEAFVVTGDLLETALGSLFSFESGVDKAGDKTNGFTKLLQVLNIALGFLSDGFTGIKIGINLLAGAVYDVAAAFTYWKSKLLFGEYKDKALKEYEELTEKSKSYYTKASEEALKFESKGVAAIKKVSQTQSEVDAAAVASSKEKLEKLLADQNTEATAKKNTEAEKIKAVQTYAEAAIAANKGVMDGTVQADLLAKGYMVTLDQSGKVAVASLAEAKKTSEETAKANEIAVQRAKQAETDYQDFLKSSAAERVLLTKQIEEAKKSGDLNALISAQNALAAIDAKERELSTARIARSAEVAQGTQSSIDQARKAGVALGLDLDVAFNRVSEGFEAGDKNLNAFTSKLGQMGATGQQAADITYQAWLKWLETAKSQAEIDAAKAKLKEFGDQGKISTSQVEQGLIAIRNQAQKLPDDIDPVTESFKRLGIETKENLKIAAQQAMMDFINVRDSGQATAEGVQKAYEKAAQAAALSGDSAVIASANAAGAGRNLEIQIDETGKATVQASNEVEHSMHRVRDATRGAQQGFRDLGATAREEALSSTEAWAKALDAQSGGMHKTVKGSKTRMAYNVQEIAAELKAMGYDDKRAKEIAENLYQSSKSPMNGYKSASSTWLAKNGYDSIGAFAGGGGGLSNTLYIKEALEKYQNYVPSSNTVAISNPKSTRRLEVSNGQQTATLEGSDQDVSIMEKIMGEFEMLKKSS
ncbi:tape measure domain-containing protein [Acinetobacter defluvii]|uniref:tape measure protein n=1 Tax=Acinetobacter defluvii TaxID=1871111 RepID=UPI00149088E6|nr:tape measure protein [Acinetobacter defluvii]NNP71299.1 tape measure domain-containing protein [Acinetobacter defluvii]